MRRATSTHAALLASPVFAASIAVLIINDHVLKAAWPGWLTGKLSDVAGVAMIAILLAALVRDVGAACLATGLGFTALKTIPAVASAAAPLLGGVTRNDPTDLVALAVLLPLRVWLTRSTRGRAELRAGTPVVAAPGREPAGGTRWLLPLQLLAVSAATFATTATSCASTRIGPIAVGDGVVLVADGDRAFASADGGWTWAPTGAASPQQHPVEACLPDGTCFRLRGESVMQHPPTGGSSVAFAYTPSELAAQERNADAVCDVDPHDGFVAIAAVDAGPGQHAGAGRHLVVTMGSQGVLVRTPDGVWSGRSVDGFGPISTDTFDLGGTSRRVLMATPVLAAVAAIGIAFGLDRRRGHKRAAALTATAVALCVGTYALLLLVSFSRIGADLDRAVATWAAVATAAWIVLLSIEAWWLRRPAPPLPPPQESRRFG